MCRKIQSRELVSDVIWLRVLLICGTNPETSEHQNLIFWLANESLSAEVYIVGKIWKMSKCQEANSLRHFQHTSLFLDTHRSFHKKFDIFLLVSLKNNFASYDVYVVHMQKISLSLFSLSFAFWWAGACTTFHTSLHIVRGSH